jgi:hypothetical protein
MPSTDTPGRAHVVLVPGFAGFDALGQIEYYAGVTPLFQRWKDVAGKPRASLHYFENLPTASVATRARRLGAYLAKRVARGEFQTGDTLALVGHSTGGLDIRHMIRELADGAGGARPEGLAVDGAEDVAPRVRPEEILGMRPRLVFLSVPQRGTNIAAWVRARGVERTVAIASLRANVAARRLPTAEAVQGWLARHALGLLEADLFRAFQDALAETDEDAIPRHAIDRPSQVADAQEAESQIALWLRHMATDFAAIDDLAPGVGAKASSPAQLDEEAREAERAAWARHGIETRSYATVAPRPFDLDGQDPVPIFNPYTPWVRPPETGLTGTDVVHRACYRACAGGPFTVPGGAIPRLELLAGRGDPWSLAPWDSDGIVNTASMLWPEGAGTRLVHADHGDVIGHFQRRPAVKGARRRFHSYDLLGSASQFGQADFEKVWGDVFAFCVDR